MLGKSVFFLFYNIHEIDFISYMRYWGFFQWERKIYLVLNKEARQLGIFKTLKQ